MKLIQWLKKLFEKAPVSSTPVPKYQRPRWIDLSHDTKKFKQSQFYVQPLLTKVLTPEETKELIDRVDKMIRDRRRSRSI